MVGMEKVKVQKIFFLESENSPVILIAHMNDLVKYFNIDVLSSDGNDEKFLLYFHYFSWI